jgi:hypothetical protein
MIFPIATYVSQPKGHPMTNQSHPIHPINYVQLTRGSRVQK